MDQDETILCANVADGVFVGNLAAAKSEQTLRQHNITAIVNVSGDDLATRRAYVEYVLPAGEILASERQKILARLCTIKNSLVELRKHHNVLVCCYEGRNQCMLVAGYYAINALGRDPKSVVQSLEVLYFNDKMRTDEARDIIRAATADPDAPAEQFTAEQFRELTASRDTRRGLRGLTIMSFQALLTLR